MKKPFLAIIIPLLALGCALRATQEKAKEEGYSNITAKEFMQKIERGERFILVDVRTPGEYAQGHIKGAILIPHTEIESKYTRLGCKCHEIVVYCRSGHRSRIGSKSLVKLGFRNVKNLVGGISAWKKAGGKVVKEE